MSEKRFEVIKCKRIVDLLNYQDRLIEEQHDEIINWTKKYVGIKKENEQLKSRIAFFEEQEDEFEKYTAQTIQNMIADYREG